MQDEVHNFTISYHKQIRSKGNLASILDNVEGIGEKRRKELLKKYKTINKIKEAQKEYYAGHPTLQDSEFDKLWDELKNLYPDSELLSEVGSDLEESDGFEKVELKSLMGSQSKANTAEEMDKFISENGNTYIETYKLDGSSAELYYENGKFIRGCSRGNGHLGVDYTKNISKMQGVVKSFSIPYTGVVKGEIVLSQKNKDKYFSEFKNKRNCATGIFHRLSGEDCDKLNFVAWDALPTDEKDYFSTRHYKEHYNLP